MHWSHAECLLGSSWIWIQGAYGLIRSWRTIHRHKCGIPLPQRQLLASLSLCSHICILHWWVLCLQKLQVCCSVGVLHLDLPGKHWLIWSQAVMGQSIWGWCCWQRLAWLTQKQSHSCIPGEVSIFSQEFLQRGGQGGQAMDKGAEMCHHGEELLEFVTFVGAGRACTASTFSRSGVHHWHHIGSQRILWLGPLHMFSVDWTQLHTCRLPAWGYADGYHVLPPCNHVLTVMSLAIPIHPGHSLRNWSIFFWKMSCEQTRPKCRCRKQYLPKGLLKVVRRLDSS